MVWLLKEVGGCDLLAAALALLQSGFPLPQQRCRSKGTSRRP
jgi:hypothetical protein